MPTDPIENTLVRYARQRVEKARKDLVEATEKATIGARPYENVEWQYPTDTEVAYQNLKSAVVKLSEAEVTLAAAMQVATFVCNESTPCSPAHMHIPRIRL